jgi:hypothetical protein
MQMLTRTHLLAALAVAGPVLTAGSAFGQSFSSFTTVDGIYGLSLQQNGLSYTITLDPGAYVIYNGNQYDVTDAFGFWALRDGASLTATGTSQNGWNWDESSTGSGSTAGWHNPAKDFDIQPGGQKTFTFDTLDQQNVDAYGFHLSFVQTWLGGGNTGFVSGPLNPVPEPATLTALGLATIAFVRRRRR